MPFGSLDGSGEDVYINPVTGDPMPASQLQQPGGGYGFAGRYAGHVAQGLGDLVTTPGAVMKPNPHQDGTEEHAYFENTRGDAMRDWSNNMALTMMGTGAPMAEAGAAGIFGGRLAKTADTAALAKAQDMARSGAAPPDIHAATGWFQGPDRQWRFEIPDNRSYVRGASTVGRAAEVFGDNGVAPAGQVFRHDPLFEAYPELADIDVSGHQHQSAFHRGDGLKPDRITVRDTSGDQRGTMLHELQHAVQAKEGFAKGGTPAQFTQGPVAAEAREAFDYNRDLADMGGDHEKLAGAYSDLKMPLPSESVRSFADDFRSGFEDPQIGQTLVKMYGLDRNASPYTPLQMYNRTAGEVEARNVTKRAAMTPEERKSTPPWETQDKPNSEQLVLNQRNRPLFPDEAASDEQFIAQMMGK